MTREEYGDIYQTGRERTIRFLLSRGAAPGLAPDIAQSAWLRGWERLSQLRDPQMIVTWINSIALNQYRRVIRTERLHQELQPVRPRQYLPRSGRDRCGADPAGMPAARSSPAGSTDEGSDGERNGSRTGDHGDGRSNPLFEGPQVRTQSPGSTEPKAEYG